METLRGRQKTRDAVSNHKARGRQNEEVADRFRHAGGVGLVRRSNCTRPRTNPSPGQRCGVPGTYKRPLFIVDGKRYELKPSDEADASVAEMLAKFSKGDTGAYVVNGTRATVNGNDGIIVEQITPAKAIPGAGASVWPKQPGYTIYDHTEGVHKFRLVVPDGLPVVRGILVVGPYSGGDSRDYHEQIWYREFLNLHGFAFLGTTNFYMHDYAVMQNALQQLAVDAKTPELVHAPYVATGFSAGGGYTRRLMQVDPDKVIAVVGSTMKLRGELTDDHRRVPMCVINGELEHEPGDAPGMAKFLEPVLPVHQFASSHARRDRSIAQPQGVQIGRVSQTCDWSGRGWVFGLL